MSFTRGQFCKDLLITLGNVLPSQQTQNFMIGWSVEESGHDLSHMAAYNLWNSTLPMPGSTVFNFANVQNYASYADGLRANAATLKNGLYPSLVQALTTNDANSLGITGPMSPGIQGDLSVWVSGQRAPIQQQYVGTIIALARNPGNAAGDVMNGTASATTPVFNGNTNTNTNTNQTPQNDPLGTISSFLQSPWLTDPTRILKLVGGLLLVAAALFLLLSPEMQPVNAAINQVTKTGSKLLS